MKRLLALLLCLTLSCLPLLSCTETPPADNTSSTDDGENGKSETPDEPGEEQEGEGAHEGEQPGSEADDPAVPPEPTPPSLPDDAVNVVEDWGLQSGTGHGKENALTLLTRFDALPDGSTVYFPEGTYELDYPLYLQNKQNIRLVGYRATLLRTGVINSAASQPASEDPELPESIRPYTASSGILYIVGDKGVSVEGLTFRYAVPTSLSGKVIAAYPANGAVDIELTDGSAVTGEEYVMAFNTFTASGVPDRTLEQYASSNFPVTKLSDTTLRVRGLSSAGVGRLGTDTRVCLRLGMAGNYVFTVFHSSDLTFENLTLCNSFNGGFLIEPRTVNATFRGVRVQSDNPNALMSLNADALHIAGLGGTLTVENCYFERAGDDCINVHTMATKVGSVSGSVVRILPARGGYDERWAAVGDTVEFFHPTTFASLGTATVTAVMGQYFTFDALPAGVGEGTVLSNRTLHPSVTVRNSHVRYNRARGFLLQTDGITVENCTFYGTALAAILIAPDLDYWFEMSPARNVTIRNNTFDNCGTFGAAVIQLAADHDTPDKTYPTYIHTDITVTGNTFTATVPALHALCCQRLTFTGNTLHILADNLLVLVCCDTVTFDESLNSRVSRSNTTGITLV